MAFEIVNSREIFCKIVNISGALCVNFRLMACEIVNILGKLCVKLCIYEVNGM